VIIPTQIPPIEPQPRGFLSALLPLLALALISLLVISILVLIGLFIWWWWEWRGMKGLSPVARAYARLERYASLVGIRMQPQQTPNERRHRLVRDLPAADRPVTAITRLYTTERYGPGPDHPSQIKRHGKIADEAWPDARESIVRRWLARLLPWRRR
jgi:hypothetical protein